jgi:hypothetical protein
VTKEEGKRKSMYQYQIAHFKMLKIEKQKLPSAQNITETKIMKIKNTKRLKDLQRVYSEISTKVQDRKDVVQVKELEKKLENSLELLKGELNLLMLEEMLFLQDHNRLNKLLEEKNALERQNQELEVKIRRAEFTRRFSMKMIETSLVHKNRHRVDKTPRKTLNSSLINCIRRLERIEKIAENSKNCKLYELHTKIIALQSKISLIKTEKEQLVALRSLDEIEQTFESSIQQIADEVSVIKREYENVIKLNDILSNELIENAIS